MAHLLTKVLPEQLPSEVHEIYAGWRGLGERRARAATLLLLALPGSAYLYQGEELGLHEVADLPDDVRQDPTFRRTAGAEPGRDGCRVPLPWTSSGPSFGFGADAADLPQPGWFARVAVDVQDGVTGSSLEMYRAALAVRKTLPTGEELIWHDSRPGVLHLERPGGWHCISTVGDVRAVLPPGQVLAASGPLGDDGSVLPDTTVWVLVSEPEAAPHRIDPTHRVHPDHPVDTTPPVHAESRA